MTTTLSPLPIAQNRPVFEELVTRALAQAIGLGATDAAAEVSEAQGLAVSVRRGKVETVEQTRDRSMDITVFAGQRRGSASTSDFSPAALRQTVEAAWHIARHTAEDPAAGSPRPPATRHGPELKRPPARLAAADGEAGRHGGHGQASEERRLRTPAPCRRRTAARFLSPSSPRAHPASRTPTTAPQFSKMDFSVNSSTVASTFPT